MAATCAQSGLGRRSGAAVLVDNIPGSAVEAGRGRGMQRATLSPARAPLQRHRQSHPGRTGRVRVPRTVPYHPKGTAP